MFNHGWPSSSGNNAPLTYVRGIPVDVTTLLTAVHVACMLVLAAFLAADREAWVDALKLKPDFALTGHIWTLVTYPFCHNIVRESIWFAVQMAIFFWFGREVERFIGRNAFAWFYTLLVLMPPVGLAALRLLFPSLIANEGIWGSGEVHFAVFCGFALIYPGVQMLFGITAKWWALIILGLSVAFDLARKDWTSLAHLLLSVGVAWSTLRVAGVGGGFEWLNWFETWRMERADRRIRQRRRPAARKKERPADEALSVDAILEKISREGMASLSAAERAALERASQQMARRDAGGPGRR